MISMALFINYEMHRQLDNLIFVRIGFVHRDVVRRMDCTLAPPR